MTSALFERLYGPFFGYEEFLCKCDTCQTGDHDAAWFCTAEFKAFMEMLINMREALGFPFQINSGHRCPAYNDEIYQALGAEPGTHFDGPHTKGAADVGCAFERAYALINLATSREMGVGPTQHGPVADRFIHVDNQGPRIWTY